MDNSTEFCAFPKIARLSREVIVTEKIDGTNAQILITDDGEILTGSRNRWITTTDDNHGFAKWVASNKEEILKLGAGRHFGEWWGSGIQRGYGLTNGDKRFSLFNTKRWVKSELPSCVGLVPVLYEGDFDTAKIESVLNELKVHGSYAVDGFMDPEGIVVFHTASRTLFKKTIKNDHCGKTA